MATSVHHTANTAWQLSCSNHTSVSVNLKWCEKSWTARCWKHKALWGSIFENEKKTPKKKVYSKSFWGKDSLLKCGRRTEVNCWASCVLPPSQGWAAFLSQSKGVWVGHDSSLAPLQPWHAAESSPQPLPLVKTALDKVWSTTCTEKEKQSSPRFFQICLQFCFYTSSEASHRTESLTGKIKLLNSETLRTDSSSTLFHQYDRNTSLLTRVCASLNEYVQHFKH